MLTQNISQLTDDELYIYIEHKTSGAMVVLSYIGALTKYKMYTYVDYITESNTKSATYCNFQWAMFNRDLNDKSMKQKLVDLSDILSIHDKITTDKLDDDKYYGYIYVADMEYADLTLSHNNDWIVKLGEMHENNEGAAINDFVKTIPIEHVNKIKPMTYLYVISDG